MPDLLFRGLFDTAFTNVIEPGDFLLCIGTALAIGLMLAWMTGWHTEQSESFSITLALLPAAVCVVIMMVNGNVGTGVAVAGAFSLVRFRSAPGTGREISAIFIAMGAGLMAGMGYLAYAVLFSLILGGAMMAYTALPKKPNVRRRLRITVPESLDYVGVFDPVLREYTREYTLRQVKSASMGSLFKLTYDLTLADAAKEKQLLDALRCRNGNLEIALSYQDTAEGGL